MYKLTLCLISFFLAAFLLLPKRLQAFDCSGFEPFLNTIEPADFIVRGKILAYSDEKGLPPALDMEVLETYKGTISDLEIRIFTDLFAPSITYFPIGTEWIFALKRVEEMSENQYTMLQGCWESYLKVEPFVVGNLSNTEKLIGTQQRVSLDEFRNLLQGADSPSLLTYEDGVQAGRQQCIDNPTSCGLSSTECSQEAFYEALTGKLYLPCVKVREVSGNTSVYEVTLEQQSPSFTFVLDLKSVKVH